MTEKRIRCEVYSRIVGYIRPIQNWNAGKRQEFYDRKTYRVPRDAEGEWEREGCSRQLVDD